MTPEHAHLDAETLAAWMDGGLDATSVSAVEAHVSNCDRCQSLVATFVRTEHTAPSTEARGTRALGSVVRWWLAPIAATAVAVIVWIGQSAIREPEPERRAQEVDSVATAPVAEPVAPAPAAPPPQDAPARADASSRQRAAQTPQQPKVADAARDDAAAGATASSKPERLERRADVQARDQRADAALPKTAMVEPPPAPAREPANEFRAERPASPAAAPAPPQAVLQKRAAPMVIVSPVPAFRWRVDTQGSIERSEDGGRSWFPIRLGAGETLSAGHSPSQHVCWIVGRGGVVLIAVDGVTFVRLPFPHDMDLVAVTSTDGRTAVVTAADGRTFTTLDTGRTWRD